MDNSATSLFKSRLNTIQKEKRYYNKFIFNGHFSVFLLILLGAFILVMVNGCNIYLNI